MRLIDADALISIIKIQLDKGETLFNDVMKKFIDILEHSPTIDAMSEVHGEWIKHKERTETNGKFIDFFPAEYECSNCGLREAHYFINSKPHNYCPNCGAKMDGEREGK